MGRLRGARRLGGVQAAAARRGRAAALPPAVPRLAHRGRHPRSRHHLPVGGRPPARDLPRRRARGAGARLPGQPSHYPAARSLIGEARSPLTEAIAPIAETALISPCPRSEEHTSELQSLMRISYAVFCLKKKN